MKKLVQYFNLHDGKTTTIPAEELAPGCILASHPTIPSGAYVDISKLSFDLIPLYATIPSEAQRALHYYCDCVAGTDPVSYETNVCRLLGSQKPLAQLALLCHIGHIFRQFSKSKVIAHLERLELLTLLINCGVAEPETIRYICPPEFLSGLIWDAVIQAYYGSDLWEFFCAIFRVEEMVFLPIQS